MTRLVVSHPACSLSVLACVSVPVASDPFRVLYVSGLAEPSPINMLQYVTERREGWQVQN